jgi:hypothetical protein
MEWVDLLVCLLVGLDGVETMATMKLSPRTKKWLRRVGYGVGALLVYGLLHVFLVAVYPDPLFPYSLRYGHFTVHMREPVPAEMPAVLDRVHALISASAINDEKLHHDVYIINSQTLARYMFLNDVGFGVSQHLGHTFIVDADVAADRARCRREGPDDHRSRTLSGTIAHEITHYLMRRHFGWRAERRIPRWLAEGYCDVIAQDSAIPEQEGLALVQSGSAARTPGLPYFRFRLAVEYLLRVKHRSLDELVADPPRFEVVQLEIIADILARRRGSE